MHKMKKSLYAVLILLLLFSLFPLSAFAAGLIDTGREASLTISYTYKSGDEKKPLPGAQFSLYRVADTDDGANLTATAAFSKYSIKLSDNTKESWSSLANTLKGYVQRDGVKADKTAATDTDGRLVFDKLKPGLFLVIGTNVLQKDNYVYSSAPFLTMLPALDANESWVYDPIISPKVNPPAATIRVIKAWDDEGFETLRPKEAEVELLCDGRLYQSAVLNKENNWGYTWSSLPYGHDWSVVEKELEGYYSSISVNGITWTVTNKYIAPVTPGEITVTKGLSGDWPASSSDFNFRLQAENDKYPMPAGSKGTSKTVTIRGVGTTTFGKISFTEPGKYTYTVSEIDNGITGYTYDRSVYTVTYTVTENRGVLSASQRIENSSGNAVNAASFINTYKTPGGRLPQTGVLWWPVPVLMLLGIVSLAVGFSRRRSCR